MTDLETLPNPPAAAEPLHPLQAAARAILHKVIHSPETIPAPETDTLNLAKLLIDNEEDPDLPPPPAVCPPNQPGIMGFTMEGMQREPYASEYIDERQQLCPRWMWNPPVAKSKPRRVPLLEDRDGVERELAKLYADFHHKRVGAADFTKRVYALDTLARIMAYGTREAAAAARRR